MKHKQKQPDLIWMHFQEQEQLSDEQLRQFQYYEAFLSRCNQEFNLTALTELSGIVRQHFSDSLMLRKYIDFSKITTIADIGTGAGFPAIPLKILYPHLSVILIEVTRKKQQFLKELIEILNLDKVEICGYDWRTFLRVTDYPVDLFVTRAAIDDTELCRAFKPACRYKQATLVYWASDMWESHPRAASFIKKTEYYKLGTKRRKFIFFGLSQEVVNVQQEHQLD